APSSFAISLPPIPHNSPASSPFAISPPKLLTELQNSLASLLSETASPALPPSHPALPAITGPTGPKAQLTPMPVTVRIPHFIH
ncbi:20041_t:CDS:1, partial [Funneliformis geosporum]